MLTVCQDQGKVQLFYSYLGRVVNTWQTYNGTWEYGFVVWVNSDLLTSESFEGSRDLLYDAEISELKFKSIRTLWG